MEKLIFLDFDGVLNEFYPNNIQNMTYGEKQDLKNKRKARQYVYNKLKNYDNLKQLHSVHHLDVKRVEILNKIIKYTDAKIVFSTSWRGVGLDMLTLLLTLRGFIYPDNCIGITPILYSNRGEEISSYLKKCKNKYKYAIIDDETCDIVKYHSEETIFKVKGLRYEDAIGIIEYLNY